MGIRIDGNTDLINAADGTLTIEGMSVNTSGMVTATGGVKVGTAATIHSTGQFNIGVAATIFANGNATFAGIVTAASYTGDGSGLTGVASTDNISTGTTANMFGGLRVGTAASVKSNGNATFAGIVTAASFSGDGSELTGVAAGVWTETAVGVSTIKTAGINTTAVKGTAAGAATSEGAVQAHGSVSVFDGFIMTDKQIDKHLTLPEDKNGILIGPVTVATGIGITIESGATLLIA